MRGWPPAPRSDNYAIMFYISQMRLASRELVIRSPSRGREGGGRGRERESESGQRVRASRDIRTLFRQFVISGANAFRCNPRSGTRGQTPAAGSRSDPGVIPPRFPYDGVYDAADESRVSREFKSRSWSCHRERHYVRVASCRFRDNGGMRDARESNSDWDFPRWRSRRRIIALVRRH